MLTDSRLHEKFSARVAAAAVGPHGRLTLPHLIRLFQEAAMRNTLRLRLSSPELTKAFGLTWILRRQWIEIDRWPTLSEPITIVTAPTGFARRLMTFRDFRLLDAHGTPIIRATTEWLLMDHESRRLRPIPERVLAIASELPDPAGCLPRPGEPPAAPSEVSGERHFRVPFYQLDFNDHLTNPSYPELMLEPLGPEVLRHHRLRTVDLAFAHEARYGQELTARTGRTSADAYAHGLYRDEQLLATMRTGWSLSG